MRRNASGTEPEGVTNGTSATPSLTVCGTPGRRADVRFATQLDHSNIQKPILR
jgi:hypothetical protein